MSFYGKSFLRIKIKKGKEELITAKNTPDYHKRAYLAASATVEAAIIIPIYIYAVMAIAYLLIMIGVRQKVNAILYDECRQYAKYAYVTTLSEDEKKDYSDILKQGINITVIQVAIHEKLKDLDSLINGFNMLNSKVLDNDNTIDLIASYYIKNPFDIFGIGKMEVWQRCKTSAWLGKNGEAKTQDNDALTKMVYITRNGRVYHTDRTCSYLSIVVTKVSYIEIGTIRNADGGKYYQCERCNNDIKSSEVYITEYGDRFHKDPNCTAISRDVLTVPLTSVLDRTECTKCRGNRND